jgi:SulP family sulfate permease
MPCLVAHAISSLGLWAATAALSAAVVADVATRGSPEFVAVTAALAITTGVVGLLAGVLRLGFVANFISEPVMKGFIIGLALTIIAGQLPKLFLNSFGSYFEKTAVGTPFLRFLHKAKKDGNDD